MKRLLTDYIQDIFESIEDIDAFIIGMSYEDFAGDKKTLNAVIRSLEIIGEAAKKIPEAIRAKHPGIPWRQMAGMRDKLIHEYHGVDKEIVWVVATEELPAILPAVERFREQEKD